MARGVDVDFVDGRLVDLGYVLLAIAAVAGDIRAVEVLIGGFDDVVLFDLGHAVEGAHSVAPFLKPEIRIAHGTDPRTVVFLPLLYALFEVGDNGRDDPILELPLLDQVNLLQEQGLDFLKGLVLFGDAPQVLGTVVVE